jgi:O-antigen/teichoic acid export membrane protein
VSIPPKSTGLRRTAVNIGLTFGRQFLAGFLQLGLLLIVARLLGPEGAGAFAIALLLPSIMSQLLNLGLVSATVYFVASGQVRPEIAWAASRDLMLGMALTGLGVGALIVLGLGERAFPGVDRSVLLTALLIFPFSLLAGLATGFFQALENFRVYNLIVLTQPGLALVIVAALWVAGRVDLGSVMSALVAAHALAFLLALCFLARDMRIGARATERLEYLRPALAYGLKVHLGNILTFLNYRLDLFLVNLIAGPAAAGLYTVAVRLVEQLWMISKATSTVIFPRLSSMSGNEDARRSFTPVMARSVMLVTLLAASMLAGLAAPLIRLLFGAEFTPATLALYIMLPGVVLLSCARVLAHDLASRGMVGINLALAGMVLLLNTVANLLLIPHYGILGAALATTMAYTLVFFVRIILQHFLIGMPWWTLILPFPEDFRRLRKAFSKRSLQ